MAGRVADVFGRARAKSLSESKQSGALGSLSVGEAEPIQPQVPPANFWGLVSVESPRRL